MAKSFAKKKQQQKKAFRNPDFEKPRFFGRRLDLRPVSFRGTQHRG